MLQKAGWSLERCPVVLVPVLLVHFKVIKNRLIPILSINRHVLVLTSKEAIVIPSAWVVYYGHGTEPIIFTHDFVEK